MQHLSAVILLYAHQNIDLYDQGRGDEGLIKRYVKYREKKSQRGAGSK